MRAINSKYQKLKVDKVMSQQDKGAADQMYFENRVSLLNIEPSQVGEYTS